MGKDIKKALEHCIEWNCIDCPNREELGSGETVCRGRLLPEVLEYVADLEAKLAEKDKEIEKLTEELDDKNFCNDFVDLYTENKLKTQILNENWKDKILFCIEQLEKVKELCREKFNWWENSKWEGDIYDKADVSNAYFDIEANIEEKIKQLKERCKND